MHLKIGIVGTGNVAKRNYIPCLSNDEHVELGYYNRTAAKATALAAEFGGQVFDTLEMLMAWEPDAVFVLTRETERLEVSHALLDLKPKRVFFEKPLVSQYGQENVRQEDFINARGLLQKALAHQCETAMVFNYRFFDQCLKAKEIIAARNFGRVVHITGLVHYACWSHGIDLVHYFADPIVELTALQSKEKRGKRTPAYDVTATFRTAADAVGTLIGTGALNWDFPLFELTFNFEGGRIHFRDLDGDMEILDDSSGQHEIHSIPRGRSRWDQYDASFTKSIVAYLASIRQDQAPPVAGIAGLQELQVEAAIKRSIALNRPVDIVAELPLELES